MIKLEFPYLEGDEIVANHTTVEVVWFATILFYIIIMVDF